MQHLIAAFPSQLLRLKHKNRGHFCSTTCVAQQVQHNLCSTTCVTAFVAQLVLQNLQHKGCHRICSTTCAVVTCMQIYEALCLQHSLYSNTKSSAAVQAEIWQKVGKSSTSSILRISRQRTAGQIKTFTHAHQTTRANLDKNIDR